MTAQPLSARSQCRVVMVEDHALFAESLDLALSVEGYNVRRVVMPPEVVSMGSLVAATLRLKPRIVLLDLDLGRYGDGVRMIEPIARAGIDVVVVTASADRARWGQALRHGARAVLTKARPLVDILATVRRLHHGLSVLDVRERENLIALWRAQRAENAELAERLERLTPREREVLAALMDGQMVHEIAARSVVSDATVRTQVKSILAKLEVSSQIAAVGLAHRIGWVPPLR